MIKGKQLQNDVFLILTTSLGAQDKKENTTEYTLKAELKRVLNNDERQLLDPEATVLTPEEILERPETMRFNKGVLTMTLNAVGLSEALVRVQQEFDWTLGGARKQTILEEMITVEHDEQGVPMGSDINFSLHGDLRQTIVEQNQTVELSTTIDIPTINRKPSMPVLNKEEYRNSITILWGGFLEPVDHVEYRVLDKNGEPLVGAEYTGSSGEVGSLSGRFTVSNLSPGTEYKVRVLAYNTYSNIPSDEAEISVKTKHLSTITSASYSPIKGSTTSVRIDYTLEETNSGEPTPANKTIIYYSIEGAQSEKLRPDNIITSGLGSRGRRVLLQAVNTVSGETTEYQLEGVKTNVAPIGSFTVEVINKVLAQVEVNAQSEITSYKVFVNNREVSVDSDGYFTIKPGLVQVIGVTLVNEETGLNSEIGTKTINPPPAAKVSLITANVLGRSQAQILFGIADGNATAFRYSLSRVSEDPTEWIEVNKGGRTLTPEDFQFNLNYESGLRSGVRYEIHIEVLDEIVEDYSSLITRQSFRTNVFKAPTSSTAAAGLAHIRVTYQIRDSVVDPTDSSVILPSNQPYVRFFTKSDGKALSANTSYTVESLFIDEYRDELDSTTHKMVNTATTNPVKEPQISLPDIQSIYDIYDGTKQPTIRVNFIDLRDYKKTAVLTFNPFDSRYIKELVLDEAPKLLPGERPKPSDTRIDYQLRVEDSIELIKLSSTDEVSFNVTIKYSEEVLIDGTLTELFSLTEYTYPQTISLGDKLLEMPERDQIMFSYSGVENVEVDKIQLTALLNENMNTLTVTFPTIKGVLGSGITELRYIFNGRTQAIPLADEQNGYFTFTVGPYKEVVRNNELKIIASDNRGLTNEVVKFVEIFEYKSPTLQIRSINRMKNNNKHVSINGLSLSYSRPPVKTGTQNNKIEQISMKYFIGNSNSSTEYPNIGSIIDKDEVNASKGSFSQDIIPVRPTSSELFAANQTYKIQFMIVDSIGKIFNTYVTTNPFLVSTGKALLFLDEENFEVGINTTAPRGALDVEGDTYTTNIYSINSMFFKKEDVEDLDEGGNL